MNVWQSRQVLEQSANTLKVWVEERAAAELAEVEETRIGRLECIKTPCKSTNEQSFEVCSKGTLL